jgi:tRNA (guanosine-2'-O-)-methyltransferase
MFMLIKILNQYTSEDNRQINTLELKELTGMTNEAIEYADEFIKIPRFGFTESFNISVSAAIILHHLIHKLQKSDMPWHLTEDEKTELRLEWLKKTIKKSSKLLS